jgi:hypothetical protein
VREEVRWGREAGTMDEEDGSTVTCASLFGIPISREVRKKQC